MKIGDKVENQAKSLTGRSALCLLAIYFVVVVVVFGAFWLGKPAGVYFHIDTARDVLQARQFLEEPEVACRMGVSSVGFATGTIWHRFVALVLMAGCRIDSLLVWLVLLQTLSCLFLFHVLRCLGNYVSAWLALCFYIWIVFDHLFYPFWQPTLVVPIANLLTLLVFYSTSRGTVSVWWFVLMLAAFSVATQVHLELFLFVPALLWLCWKSGRRMESVVALVVTTVLGWWLFSKEALAANFARLKQMLTGDIALASMQRGAMCDRSLTIALGLAAIAGIFYYSMKKRTANVRYELFYKFCIVATFGYLLIVVAGSMLKRVEERYLVPLFPFAAAMIAGLTQKPLGNVKRCGRMVVAVVATVVFFSKAATSYGEFSHLHRRLLTFGEIESISRVLVKKGYDADRAFRYVHPVQQAGWSFIGGVWAFSSCMKHKQRLGEDLPVMDDLILLVVPESSKVEPGHSSGKILLKGVGRSLVLVPSRQHFHNETIEVCYGARDGKPFCKQQHLSFENRGYGRSCLYAGWPHDALDRGGSQEDDVYISYSVSNKGERGVRRLVLSHWLWSENLSTECMARIKGVEGYSFKGGTDGRSLEINLPEGSRAGLITVRIPCSFEKCNCQALVLPRVVEVEQHIFQALSSWREN